MLSFSYLTQGQHPSYYYLGAKELEGIDIYDIHQDRNGTYWIATDNGIFRHNGYEFRKLDTKEMLSTSVFDLTENQNGELFCYNLSGQVFQVKNGVISLYYTIPKKHLDSDIHIAVDKDDVLWIFSQSIISMKDDEPVYYTGINEQPYEAIGMVADLNGTLYFQAAPFNNMHKIHEGSPRRIFTAPPDTNRKKLFHCFSFNDSLFAYENRSFDLWNLNRATQQPVLSSADLNEHKAIYKYYPTSDYIWITSNTSGVYQLDRSLRIQNEGRKLFPKTFISTVFEDREGNMLMGTFGNGIILIPNMNMTDFEMAEKALSIVSNGNGDLFLGTSTGKVYSVTQDNTLVAFRDNQVKSIEMLYTFGDSHLIVGEFEGMLIDLKSRGEQVLQTSSLKDAFPVNDSLCLLASNIAASLLNIHTGKTKLIEGFSMRHYCVGMNRSSGEIYAGTTSGLAYQAPDQEMHYLLIDGKPIVARDIQYRKERVYISTVSHGILIYKGKDLVAQWSSDTGLPSDHIKQIRWKDDRLYAATDKGMALLSEQGRVLNTINYSCGLYSDNVNDFDFRDNELWMVHSKGIQVYNLNALTPFDYTPELKIENVLLHDTSGVAGLNLFSNTENSFKFELVVQNLKYQKEISYQFRLKGADNRWQENPFNDHVIAYKSLSPGEYTFEAKATCRGNASAPVSYSFTIKAPFWQNWWFITIVFLLILGAVVYIYSRRLKRQRVDARRRDELNSSKLTAIQSQMNPHFIFNALNSIQDLVLKQDVENSYNYITKFANLVRSTLNFSDKDFIDFDSELKLIDLYLTLEKLRFKEDLQFSINTNGIQGIAVPPMLIQPFIENALVHGLLHKDGLKRIEIDFQLSDQLVCTITDNGIGRKKSKEINLRQRKGHESFSENAIEKRFQILEENFGGDLGFSYEDLESNGEPCGTKVYIHIPYIRSY